MMVSASAKVRRHRVVPGSSPGLTIVDVGADEVKGSTLVSAKSLRDLGTSMGNRRVEPTLSIEAVTSVARLVTVQGTINYVLRSGLGSPRGRDDETRSGT